MKQVYVLRHGEKDESGELTEQGKRSARRLGELLPDFDIVVASEVPRAIETAALLAAREPTTDDRAGYYSTTQDASDEIAALAAERGVTFLEAACSYDSGALREGIQAQAAGLNDLARYVLTQLSDGGAGLIVSHDMTIAPAMALLDVSVGPVNCLSGYVLEDNGVLSVFSA